MTSSARPVVHFTPPQGWLNDPNGLVSLDGRHHLFYQHYPAAAVWGPMHWGHAVSSDFVTWRHLPIALAPDESGMIFSGSAVVDATGSAGFGPGALVAVYTYHHQSDGESQAIAWSHDGGNTFTKFAGNPVIPVVAARRLCRDPKVFRHAAHWVMLLAAEHEVWIHTSDDLKTWRRTDVVGGFDVAGGAVETPDLFALDADDGTTHWVLAVGLTRGAPAGGSGMAAQVGTFDGERFTPRDELRWVDHGPSFYAAQSWNDVADGRRIWIAWMGNWADPAAPDADADWRGQMSVPRQLSLRAVDGGYRLIQSPVAELAGRYADGQVEESLVVSADGRDVGPEGAALDVGCHGIATGSGRLEIVCARGSTESVVTVTADSVAVDRHRAALDHAPLDLRVILDTASIEVLCDTTSITVGLEARDDPWTVRLAAPEGDVRIERLAVHALA